MKSVSGKFFQGQSRRTLGLALLALAAAQPASAASAPRTLSDRPFSATSIWNTPLGVEAAFQTATAPESQMLHSDDIGGHSKSYAWIGFDATAVYKAKDTDPLEKWDYDSRSATAPWPSKPPLRNGSIRFNTPVGIGFYGTTDKVAVIIDPTGTTAYEMWRGSHSDALGSYHASYLIRVDLKGSGIASGEGRSEGVRAFGGSILGGLIRCSELETREIPHAVAVLISPTQARKGATGAEQRVWPAMQTDNGGKNSYEGLVPMGRLLAIPPSVDISKLALTPEGEALAHAFQRYGGYVVDTATNTMSIGAVEQGCNRPLIDNLFKDVRKIRDQLLPVTNSDKDHIGGPGARVVAPAPLAP